MSELSQLRSDHQSSPSSVSNYTGAPQLSYRQLQLFHLSQRIPKLSPLSRLPELSQLSQRPERDRGLRAGTDVCAGRCQRDNNSAPSELFIPSRGSRLPAGPPARTRVLLPPPPPRTASQFRTRRPRTSAQTPPVRPVSRTQHHRWPRGLLPTHWRTAVSAACEPTPGDRVMTRPINQLAVSRAVVHTELRRRGGRQDKAPGNEGGGGGGRPPSGEEGRREGAAGTRSRLNVTDSSSDIPTRIPCGNNTVVCLPAY